MLSGIYIYIYIRYKSNGGLGSLPAAYRFLFQLSFLPTFPIVRRKYRIENWFLTRPTLLPPTPPIYKENGGLTFHSWTVHIYIYIYVFLFFFFFFGVSSLRNVDDPLPFRHRESVPWENVKIVSINVSMKQEEGLRRKLGTDVWIIRIEIRLFEFIERIDRFDKIQSISHYFDLNWLKLGVKIVSMFFILIRGLIEGLND